METNQTHLQVFEIHRPYLAGLVYRMTGSLTDADDIVQDAWLRWSRVDPAIARAHTRRLPQACLPRASTRRGRAPAGETVALGRQRLHREFQHALTTGDVASFAKMLAEDAKLIANGGGKVYAALNPIEGRDRIVRFLAGLVAKFGVPREIRRLPLNGDDGLLIIEGDGGMQTWSIDWNANAEAQTIYAVRYPDKLRRLAPAVAGRPV